MRHEGVFYNCYNKEISLNKENSFQNYIGVRKDADHKPVNEAFIPMQWYGKEEFMEKWREIAQYQVDTIEGFGGYRHETVREEFEGLLLIFEAQFPRYEVICHLQTKTAFF